jgi:hypothetical protein
MGLAVSFWTNLLSITLTYTVLYLKAIKLLKQFNSLFMMVMGPALGYSLTYFVYDVNTVNFGYSLLRLLSIGLNIFSLVVVERKLGSMRANTDGESLAKIDGLVRSTACL